jgi:hypothetical protein
MLIVITGKLIKHLDIEEGKPVVTVNNVESSAWSVYKLLLSKLFTVTTGFPSSMSSAWSVYKLLLWTLFTVTTGFPSSMSSAWSVYKLLLSTLYTRHQGR